MKWLLLIFIVVPAVELAILIEIGTHLGTIPTLALILSTGALGAFLARLQGLSVLRTAHLQMERGELPAGPLADGVLILVAATLLITPGVVTDAAGFLLLVPRVRQTIKRFLLGRFRRAVEDRRIDVQVVGVDPSSDRGRVYDLHPEPPESDADPSSPGGDGAPKYTIH